MLDEIEEVQAALARHIPEFAAGPIEILDIVRVRGRQSKVLISPLAPSRISPPLLRRAVAELGEPIRIVELSDNQGEFLLRCLAINRSSVKDLAIDSRRRIAEVKLRDTTLVALAIGGNGSNVRLAEQLTGLSIRIALDTDGAAPELRPDADIPPEEELRHAFEAEFAELATHQVELAFIAREPGVRSVVVIRPTIERVNVLAVCDRWQKTGLDGLRQSFVEDILLVAWSSDREVLIRRLLNLRKRQITAISFDDRTMEAIVTVVNDEIASAAIGHQGVNVRQACAVLGLRRVHVHFPS